MKNSRGLVATGLILLVLLMAGAVGWASYRAVHRRFTYVIVHGAYGGGWNYRQVDALLTADGQKVFRPTLTGQGEKYHLANPDVNLNTHIQDVVNMILFEDLHDVVLVGHSYGGMVITGVVDRIPDRIKSVIYLDAILPEDGESANTADNGVLHHPANPKLNAQGSIMISWFKPSDPLPHDEPEPAGAFAQPISLTNQTVARAKPTTFVLFVAKGKETAKAKFYAFYQRAIARGWQTMTFQSDHNAQWSHPRELANLLEKLP
jgi:pimeloyl-ACP methyl ester carboxylesterase